MENLENKLRKYASLILDKCLEIENDSLYISVSPDAYDIAYIIYDEALKRKIKNIDLDFRSSKLKYSELKYKSEEDLYLSPYFDRSKLDLYTERNYAFLFLESFDEVESIDELKEKELKLDKFSKNTCKKFRKEEGCMNISWCIACVATHNWANKLFKDVDDSYIKLWETIFDICYINTDDPISSWEEERKRNKELCNKLNSMNIKTLHYKNSLGTNFNISLGENTIFLGLDEKLKGKKDIIVNLPSFEIFTSPIKTSANGIVYSSKPLVYNANIIDKFYIKFENGKVIDYDAEKGKDILDNIINTDLGSHYLGEVALVPYDSKISKTGICFYHTLYDENSSCHLALGDSFPNVIKDLENFSDDDYEKYSLNKSITHVDFMIGTNDLEINAETYDGKTIKIFDKGNFCI